MTVNYGPEKRTFSIFLTLNYIVTAVDQASGKYSTDTF
jgi:hypothetical protein